MLFFYFVPAQMDFAPLCTVFVIIFNCLLLLSPSTISPCLANLSNSFSNGLRLHDTESCVWISNEVIVSIKTYQTRNEAALVRATPTYYRMNINYTTETSPTLLSRAAVSRPGLLYATYITDEIYYESF